MFMKKVMVFGSFDVLHDGHRSLFRQAKLLGDTLVVVVARDTTYERLRNHMPLHNEYERLKRVGEEAVVDQAFLGDNNNVYKIVSSVRPDIVALGYDQKNFVDDLREKLNSFELQKTTIVRLDAHHPEKFKSSLYKKIE